MAALNYKTPNKKNTPSSFLGQTSRVIITVVVLWPLSEKNYSMMATKSQSIVMYDCAWTQTPPPHQAVTFPSWLSNTQTPALYLP